MKDGTLLGHLAINFAEHPENLATRSLAYILERSSIARGHVARLLRLCGVQVPESLIYRTEQSAPDQTRPDLSGYNQQGREVILIEAKFWADLTPNQPCAYLLRLSEGTSGALLCVAPDLRLETLWRKLLEQCKSVLLNSEPQQTSCVRHVAVTGGRCLALVSWRMLLSPLAAELETAGEFSLAGDVRQLEGLCNRMDSDVFLPLRPEDLAPGIPRRITQLAQIIDVAANAAIGRGFASKKNPQGGRLNPASTARYSGRFLAFGEIGVALLLHWGYWAKWYETPLWLCLYGTRWDRKTLGGIRARLHVLETEPRRLFADDADGGTLCIPICLPLGVEKDAVVKEVTNQMEQVALVLSRETPEKQL